MENYHSAILAAKEDLKLADHMINVTYKLVTDPKMLLSVMHRLMRAVTNIIHAIVEYERSYKRISAYPADFESVYKIFKSHCTKRYNFNIEYIKVIEEIRDIMRKHKESPIEFSRNNKLVICTDNYRMRVITIDKIKKYINKAKLFQKDVERLVTKHGRNTI